MAAVAFLSWQCRGVDAHAGRGEVSELADERDLGSRGAIRESSNLSFPI